MPVEILSDDQAAVYGVFAGPPSAAELDKFFLLDDADRELVRGRRGGANRLGFAVQLGTVRFLGTFLADPLAVPASVAEYVARQLAPKRTRPRRKAEGKWLNAKVRRSACSQKCQMSGTRPTATAKYSRTRGRPSFQ